VSARFFATAASPHNKSTLPVEDALSANQLKALEDNAAEYGISALTNGIVHVVGPENKSHSGTIVCGDSPHTRSFWCNCWNWNFRGRNGVSYSVHHDQNQKKCA
jgi:homoaconitase/3-isopropylmalate dehydratase large subunit